MLSTPFTYFVNDVVIVGVMSLRKQPIERIAPAAERFTIWMRSVMRNYFRMATSKPGSGGRRYQPCVLTEQGVAMLSSVLNGERTIEMNVLIVRAFFQLRGLLTAPPAAKTKRQIGFANNPKKT